MVVRGGSDPGVALRLSLDADLAIGSVVQIHADLDLSLNTFGRDVVYVVRASDLEQEEVKLDVNEKVQPGDIIRVDERMF